MENLVDLKFFAKNLAEISGKVIKTYFRKKLSVNDKEDNSPVTIADMKAEELMREEIIKNFPDHGIIGEEFGSYNSSAEYQWVLDPIDGTKSFICGAVNFGTLIAFLKNGNPVFGVFNQPILNEFLFGDNKTAELNDVRVVMRDCKNLSDAVLLTTDYLNVEKYQDIHRFNSLIHKVKIFRGWGDCYGYYLLASGFADIMVDPIMSFWDTAAIVPIIKGAGGVITDYYGNDPVKGNSIIAAPPELHPKVIKELTY